MDAVAALAELKDLSTQIEVVVLAYRSGEVQASTVSGQTTARSSGASPPWTRPPRSALLAT